MTRSRFLLGFLAFSGACNVYNESLLLGASGGLVDDENELSSNAGGDSSVGGSTSGGGSGGDSGGETGGNTGGGGAAVPGA